MIQVDQNLAAVLRDGWDEKEKEEMEEGEENPWPVWLLVQGTGKDCE